MQVLTEQIGGKRVKFLSIMGTVTSIQTKQNTKVTSSGGGGFVGPHGGYVSAPQIKSETVTTLEVWIKDEETELEDSFTFIDGTVTVRPGHRVLLCWGIPSGKERGPFLFLVNFATGKIDKLTSSDAFFDDFSNYFYNPLVILTTYIAAVAGFVGGIYGGYQLFNKVTLISLVGTVGIASISSMLLAIVAQSIMSSLLGPNKKSVIKDLEATKDKLLTPAVNEWKKIKAERKMEALA